MTLTGSPNEHHAKLFRVRERVRDLCVAPKPLAAGDYMFEAHGKLVCIEVKWSIGDLTQSLKPEGEDKGTRLGIEVRKLTSIADIPYLIIPPLRDRGDGKLEYDAGAPVNDRGWDYNAVKGVLTSIALYGVIVDEWDGDIASRIAQLYFVLTKKEHSWIRQRGRPDFVAIDPVYSEAVWMLCSVTGWGPDKAQAALKEFGSIRGVINAPPKELEKRVHGVGKTLAENMERVVSGSYA